MSDDELERIRERKREELKRRESDSGSASQGDAGDEETPNTPIEVEGQSHFEEVTSAHDLVLVDCYADWCGPCQMMEPTIESIAAESGAAVAKVDIDRHQVLAQELGVQGVPTLVVFAEGNPVKRVVGAQDRATLDNLLAQAS
jgi:thioredoxin 1